MQKRNKESGTNTLTSIPLKTLVPEGSKAVIFGIYTFPEGDPGNEYVVNRGKVVLGFSKTTRVNMKELKEAAKRFQETEKLAHDKEYEIRHKGKTFLGIDKNKYIEGWRVRKIKLTPERMNQTYTSDEIFLPVLSNK